MDEKKLAKIQSDILKGIDKELEQDKEIKNNSEEIAYSLYKRGKVNFILDFREYLFHYKTYTNTAKKPCIVMYVTDVEISKKAKLGDYSPAVVNSEIDNSLPLRDNLQATVEAFIRHKLGAVKPEAMADEGIIQ